MLPASDSAAPPVLLAKPGPVLKAKEYQHVAAGEEVLAQAHARAKAITEQAQTEYQRALRKGFRLGLSQARRREARRHFATIARAIDYLAQLEDRMIAMADEAIRLIIGQNQAHDIEWHLLRRALARYRSLPDLTLRVPAEQESWVRGKIAELAAAGGQHWPSLRIEGDAKLEAGSCILESPLGKVNIGLANQLAVLHRALENSKNEPLGLKPEPAGKQ